MPVDVALRRSRTRGVVHVGCLLALEFGLALIVRPDPDPPVMLLVLSIVAGIFTAGFPARNKAKGPARAHGPNRMLLTARTSAGERTLDLRQISRVSSFQIPNKGTAATEVLTVKDSRGIRLGLTSPDEFAMVRKAVKSQARKPELPSPKITRRARRLLDAGELPWWWGTLSTLGTLVYAVSLGLIFFVVALGVAET